MRGLLEFAGTLSLLLLSAVPAVAEPPDESGRVVWDNIPFSLSFPGDAGRVTTGRTVGYQGEPRLCRRLRRN